MGLLWWGALVSGTCPWGSWLLWLSCFRDVISVPGRGAYSLLAMHPSPHPYIAQYRHFRSPSQPPPREEQQGGSHSCCKSPFFLQRQKSVCFHTASRVAVIIILFYSFLSCPFKIVYVYPLEHNLDASRIFPGRCPSEFGGILCSICTSSHI